MILSQCDKVFVIFFSWFLQIYLTSNCRVAPTAYPISMPFMGAKLSDLKGNGIQWLSLRAKFRRRVGGATPDASSDNKQPAGAETRERRFWETLLANSCPVILSQSLITWANLRMGPHLMTNSNCWDYGKSFLDNRGAILVARWLVVIHEFQEAVNDFF